MHDEYFLTHVDGVLSSIQKVFPLHILNGNDCLHKPYNHQHVQTKHALKCDLVRGL